MQHIILNSISNQNLDEILGAYPDYNIFYLEAGEYRITKMLNLNRAGIRLIGVTNKAEDVHIRQIVPTENGIHISANNVGIESISIHNENGEGMCLSHGNANWASINNCHFYGNGINHTVYFSGPPIPEGKTIPDMFIEDRLDMHNTFDDNIIYTNVGGDSFGFNLQKFGTIRDNIIRGGPIKGFLLKDCLITNNHIFDSTKQGLSISLPAVNIQIENNFIKNSTAASFNLKTPDDLVGYIDQTNNITIKNNIIKGCEYIAFEIDKAKNIVIVDNIMLKTRDFGIYLLRTSNIEARNNRFIQNRRGVHIDIDSSNNIIDDNEFYSVQPTLTEHAILLEQSTTLNTIINNSIHGMYLSSEINNLGIDNNVANNIYKSYITFTDEILKLLY